MSFVCCFAHVVIFVCRRPSRSTLFKTVFLMWKTMLCLHISHFWWLNAHTPHSLTPGFSFCTGFTWSLVIPTGVCGMTSEGLKIRQGCCDTTGADAEYNTACCWGNVVNVGSWADRGLWPTWPTSCVPENTFQTGGEYSWTTDLAHGKPGNGTTGEVTFVVTWKALVVLAFVVPRALS